MLTIRDLPPELVTNICDYLPRPSLRNVRLLTHTFDNASQQLLFRVVSLKVNQRSFRKLKQIAESDQLRCCVEHFSYNGNELHGPKKSDEAGFREWKRVYAGRGLGMCQDARRAFLNQISDEELRAYYHEYRNHLRDQKRALLGSYEPASLWKILGRFPQLLSIEYTEDALHYESANVIGLSSLPGLGEIASTILALPETGYGDHDFRFWRLLRVLSVLDKPPKLTKFAGLSLGPEVFDFFERSSEDIERKILPKLRNVMKCVKELQISFVWDCCISSSEGGLVFLKFLDVFPALRSFKLGFGPYPEEDMLQAFSAPVQFLDASFWEHLHTLSLGTITLTSTSLRQLLKRHSKTLRSLELSHITLRLSEEDELPSRRDRAHWIEMFTFLNQVMSLEHASLDGLFFSEMEAWTTLRAGPGSNTSLRKEGSLLVRIERFITRCGPPPFVRKEIEEVTGEVFHPEEFWTWDKDDFWTFDISLLVNAGI